MNFSPGSLEVRPTVSEPALVKSPEAPLVKFRPFSMVKLPLRALVVRLARAFEPEPFWFQSCDVAPSRRMVDALVEMPPVPTAPSRIAPCVAVVDPP